jgi:hypothetical protein
LRRQSVGTAGSNPFRAASQSSTSAILRWTAAGVLEAERHFCKVAGYRALPKLVAALRAHDAAIDRDGRVENGERAA